MAEETKEKKSGGINFKALIIGIPLFILQVFAIYYITATVLLNTDSSSDKDSKKAAKHVEAEDDGHGSSDDGHDSSDDHYEETPVKDVDEEGYYEPPVQRLGEHIFAIEDIIVNPAGTNGKRLLLTSIGLDVPTEVQLQELQKKEILVKDLIVNLLSSKNLNELRSPQKKEELKKEITVELKKLIRKVKINRVYFSKYIIQ